MGFYESQLTLLIVITVLLLLLERRLSSRASTFSQTKATPDPSATSAASSRDHLDDALENGEAPSVLSDTSDADSDNPLLSSTTGTKNAGRASTVAGARAAALRSLMRKYLTVYAIVMGADWLQGPYVYSLYREQYGFPEQTVALLFVTGFVSAGLFAPLVGVWADQYGRRLLCLLFCITYTATCALLLIPSFPILLFGRILGGISTSILFSAFESWVVSSSATMGLGSDELSKIMGRATLVNGFVATAAGVFSNKLVEWNSGGFRSPFVASGALLLLAFVVIRGSWSENYGANSSSTASNAATPPTSASEKLSCVSWRSTMTLSGLADLFQVRRLGSAGKIVIADPNLLVLGLTQTIFEGSMYLFVFIWVPSLQASSALSIAAEGAAHAHESGNDTLPLGYIFSAFMISMMLGSLSYTFITAHWHRPTPSSSTASTSAPSSASTTTAASVPPPLHTHARSGSTASVITPLSGSAQTDSTLVLHAKLSSLVCALSALAFAASVSAPKIARLAIIGIGRGSGGGEGAKMEEHVKFWAFCVFEGCVGMYYPVQGMLRGTLIGDGYRATLAALFRVPLNIFVVVSLLTGVSSSAREVVLSTCAIVLVVASLVTAVVVVPRVEGHVAGRGPGEERTDRVD